MEITTMITGVNVKTIIDRPSTFENILIDAVDTNLPLNALNVTVGGQAQIQIEGTNSIMAFAKYLMSSILGADVKVGLLIKAANNFIGNQAVQVVLTNSGATTPKVYAFSTGKTVAVPVKAGQRTLQASDSLRFTDFTGLFFDPANFNYAIIQFADGFEDQLSAKELAALFGMSGNSSDADGLLATQVAIDNKRGNIRSATLYTTSGGSMVVTQCKLL
jgi:hypothetical protein